MLRTKHPGRNRVRRSVSIRELSELRSRDVAVGNGSNWRAHTSVTNGWLREAVVVPQLLVDESCSERRNGRRAKVTLLLSMEELVVGAFALPVKRSSRLTASVSKRQAACNCCSSMTWDTTHLACRRRYGRSSRTVAAFSISQVSGSDSGGFFFLDEVQERERIYSPKSEYAHVM